MKKYKICVYAISKNEEKYALKWYNSMKEADEIYVLDTGSTDNTVPILKSLGVHVTTKIINPWRFDVARNESLKLLPKDTDIYVCTDLDEIFLPGWRQELEKSWDNDTVQAKYRYNWLLDKNNKPKLSFLYDKIHNANFEWKYPIHEILKYNSAAPRKTIILKNVTLNHYQDKSKNRTSYNPLLELALKENPTDLRCIYLLARQEIYNKNWDKCLELVKKYLEVNPHSYYIQRATMLRYAGRSYRNLDNYNEAKKWYEKAIKTAPNIRDGYVELAMLEFSQYNYGNTISLLEKALTITENSLNVINEIFAWDDTLYCLLSESYIYAKNPTKALEYINIALTMNPDNKKSQQIKQDIELIIKSI